jgi:hypothetical protein
MHKGIILAAAIVGIVLVGYVSSVARLTLLWGEGVRTTGLIVKSEPGARAPVSIRISGPSPVAEVSVPCVGIPCAVGTVVPVTRLARDPSVIAVGDLEQQFWTSILFTFIAAPLFFGGGVAYSLLMVGRERVRVIDRKLGVTFWQILPMAMCGGVIVSTAVLLAVGGRPSLSRVSASVFLALASLIYWRTIRRRGVGRRRFALAGFIFAAGVVLILLDLSGYGGAGLG